MAGGGAGGGAGPYKRFISEKVAAPDGRRSVRFYLVRGGGGGGGGGAGGAPELAAWGEERETRDGHYVYRRAEGFEGGPPLHCGNLAGVHDWLAAILGQDPKAAVRASRQYRSAGGGAAPPAPRAGGGAPGAGAGAGVGFPGDALRADGAGGALAGPAGPGGRGTKRGRAQEELARIARDLHECGRAAAAAQKGAVEHAAGLAREAALRWVGAESGGGGDEEARQAGTGPPRGKGGAAPGPHPWEGLPGGKAGADPGDGLTRALKLLHEVRELRARPPGTLAAFEGALSDLERRSEGLEGEPGEAVRAGLQGLRDGHFGLVTRLTAAALGGFYAPVPPPPQADAADQQRRPGPSSLAAALWYGDKKRSRGGGYPPAAGA